MATRRVFRALVRYGYSIPRRPIDSPRDHFRRILTPVPGSIPRTSNLPSAKFAAVPSHLCNTGARSLFQRYLATSSEDPNPSSEDGVDTASDINARVFSRELEKDEIQQADEIGYKIACRAKTGERPNKPKDPIFAVVQVGSHQFKVSCGDRIVVEKLKFADVNQKALSAEVIIFKKKRRKNYRRTNYHRQELTRLRIYDIQGLEESLGENAVAA